MIRKIVTVKQMMPAPECRGDIKCPPGSPPECMEKQRVEIMQYEVDQMLLYVVMYGAFFFLIGVWKLYKALRGHYSRRDIDLDGDDMNTPLIASGRNTEEEVTIFLVLKFIVSDEGAEPKTHVDKEEAKKREGYEIIADLQISKVQQVQQKIWRGTIIG